MFLHKIIFVQHAQPKYLFKKFTLYNYIFKNNIHVFSAHNSIFTLKKANYGIKSSNKLPDRSSPGSTLKGSAACSSWGEGDLEKGENERDTRERGQSELKKKRNYNSFVPLPPLSLPELKDLHTCFSCFLGFFFFLPEMSKPTRKKETTYVKRLCNMVLHILLVTFLYPSIEGEQW